MVHSNELNDAHLKQKNSLSGPECGNNTFSHLISICLTLVLFHLSMTCSITTSMFEVAWWLANSLLSLIKNWFFNICSHPCPEHISLHNTVFICIRNTRNTHGTFKCQLTNVNGFCPNKITTGNHKNRTVRLFGWVLNTKKEEFCLFNIGWFCVPYMNRIYVYVVYVVEHMYYYVDHVKYLLS